MRQYVKESFQTLFIGVLIMGLFGLMCCVTPMLILAVMWGFGLVTAVMSIVSLHMLGWPG